MFLKQQGRNWTDRPFSEWEEMAALVSHSQRCPVNILCDCHDDSPGHDHPGMATKISLHTNR